MSDDTRDTITAVAIILIPGIIAIFAILQFTVYDYKVVLISPTEEQVLDLYKSSETDRFWVREAHAVKGERSLIEATIGVRRSDGGEERVREQLDELGLEYYVVGKAGKK